jgi:hypothetical protein
MPQALLPSAFLDKACDYLIEFALFAGKNVYLILRMHLTVGVRNVS